MDWIKKHAPLLTARMAIVCVVTAVWQGEHGQDARHLAFVAALLSFAAVLTRIARYGEETR